MTRKEFLEKKFKEWKKFLEDYLPDETYKLEFEDILNQIQDLLC